MEKLRKLLKDEEGLEIVEWALLCAGFALACVAVMPTLVTAISDFYTLISDTLNGMPAT